MPGVVKRGKFHSAVFYAPRENGKLTQRWRSTRQTDWHKAMKAALDMEENARQEVAIQSGNFWRQQVRILTAHFWLLFPPPMASFGFLRVIYFEEKVKSVLRGLGSGTDNGSHTANHLFMSILPGVAQHKRGKPVKRDVDPVVILQELVVFCGPQQIDPRWIDPEPYGSFQQQSAVPKRSLPMSSTARHQ